MPLSDYSRTTAQGRLFWEAVEALPCALDQLVEDVNDRVVTRLQLRWPDLRPALAGARQCSATAAVASAELAG